MYIASLRQSNESSLLKYVALVVNQQPEISSLVIALFCDGKSATMKYVMMKFYFSEHRCICYIYQSPKKQNWQTKRLRPKKYLTAPNWWVLHPIVCVCVCGQHMNTVKIIRPEYLLIVSIVRRCVSSKDGVVVASRVDGSCIPNYNFIIWDWELEDTYCCKKSSVSCRCNNDIGEPKNHVLLKRKNTFYYCSWLLS